MLLAMYQIQWMNELQQPPLKSEVFFAIIFSCFCFIFGWAFSHIRFSTAVKRRPFLPMRRYLWDHSRVEVLAWLCLILGLIVWIYFFIRAGGFISLFKNPTYFKLHFFSPILDDVYRLLPFSGFLFLWIAITATSKRKKLLSVYIWFLTALLILATLARSELFLYLAVSGFIYAQKRRVRLYKICISVLFILGLFVGIQAFREGDFSSYDKIDRGIYAMDWDVAWIEPLIRYTVPNIRNIQIAMDNCSEHTFGAHTFYPIFSFTRTTDLLPFKKARGKLETARRRKEYGIGIFIPYLAEIYWDFGWIGVICFPFFIGYLSSGIFYKAKKTGGAKYIFLYAIMAYALMFSLQKNTFSDSNVWILTGLVLVADLVLRTKNQCPVKAGRGLLPKGEPSEMSQPVKIVEAMHNESESQYDF